jgi:hypothetical protein
MKNFFITFAVVLTLAGPSCGNCTDGWKHIHDSDTATQIDSQQLSWNYLLLFPMFRYIPEHGTA